MAKAKRTEWLIEGLNAIGANVVALAEDLERCREARAFRAGTLARNALREEAGKFLILMDIYRLPRNDQGLVEQQLKRATNHMAKLIYDQMTDYCIGDRRELVEAVDRHRASHYLDGPNDVDWIFRNALIDDRERALYVDLVDSEGELMWWTPPEDPYLSTLPDSAQVVYGIMECRLVTPAGFDALEAAWKGFDGTADSHCSDWGRRTIAALTAIAPDSPGDDWQGWIRFLAQNWVMPMVELEVEELRVTTAELEQDRADWVDAQFGHDDW
jgi:AbiV family abortive infection protein